MTFLEIPHKKCLGVLMCYFYGFGCPNDRRPAGYDYQKNYGGTVKSSGRPVCLV